MSDIAKYKVMWKELKESIPQLTCEGDIIHVSDLEKTIREIELDHYEYCLICKRPVEIAGLM